MEIKRQSIAFNIINNFKEVEIDPVVKVTNILNENFNKGLVDELTTNQAFEELDNLIKKGIGSHKYYKREGAPGNYKYYYTEQEYKEAKGGENKEIKGGEKKEDKGEEINEGNKKFEYNGVTIYTRRDTSGGQNNINYKAPDVSDKWWWNLDKLKQEIDKKKGYEKESKGGS